MLEWMYIYVTTFGFMHGVVGPDGCWPTRLFQHPKHHLLQHSSAGLLSICRCICSCAVWCLVCVLLQATLVAWWMTPGEWHAGWTYHSMTAATEHLLLAIEYLTLLQHGSHYC